MKTFALLGAGFWAGYQIAAWQEVDGARCVAVADPDLAKGRALAERFGIARVHTDADAAMEGVDFVDIVTPPPTHPTVVRQALRRGLPTICQKPLAEGWDDAVALASEAAAAGVPLLVHENWRWQTPIRALKATLDTGVLGEIFRARLTMVSGFPVFANQPGLKTLERFLLADMGVHTLDTARFLFGEAQSVYCHARRVQPDIAGEDAATVLTRHGGVSVATEMGFVQNFLERDRFPETFIYVEGTRGTIELAPDFWLRTTTQDGTHAQRVPPPRYVWADPAYDVVHASMPPCLADLLRGVSGEPCETRADDNLKTLRLVFAAYESAASGQAVVV